jgi:thiol-disulfide isomerase/thioredoxin
MAVLLSAFVNGVLMRWSADPQKNWLFRLTISTVVMVAPFAVTLLLAMKDRHRSICLLSGKFGLAMAILSLGLIAKPVSDGLTRSKQERNKLMRDVAAPLFETTDLFGNRQRLADYRGKVVLVNIWATWCAPCRAEMPALDHLYRERKDRGLVVLGHVGRKYRVPKEISQRSQCELSASRFDPRCSEPVSRHCALSRVVLD